MKQEIMGYVFTASPRRRLGVRARFESGRRARREERAYGVALAQ
jgi:hypothetical protein